MKTTLKDIAKLAGVSFQAVSAVLNGRTNSRVSLKTRERIMDIALNLNYVPNLAARSLRQPSAEQRVGIIKRMYQPTLYDDLIDVVTRTLRSLNYQVISTLIAQSGEIDCAVAELRNLSCQTILNISGDIASPRPEIVAVGFTPDCAVRIAWENSGEIAVRHLQQHGYRKMAIVKTGTNATTALQEQGCFRAIKADNQLKILNLTWNENFASELQYLIKQEKIDAFIGMNDYISGKLQDYLYSHQLPELPIISFGGYSFAEFTRTPLTTVVLPLHTAAHAAVQKIVTPDTPQQVIAPYLHQGASCGCPRAVPATIYWEGALETLESLKNNIIKPSPERKL